MAGFKRNAIVFAGAALASVGAWGASNAEAPQQFAQLGHLKLENGGQIRDCALGYRTLGKLNADASNAILFTTWHTGTSKDALSMIDAKSLFDPAPYYVIVVDAIGNGVSCSPSNSKQQHGTAFPAFGIRDMVQSQHRLLTEKLGIRHLHAVIGYSMGGMQAFQWRTSYPDFMDVVVPISGTPRLSSYDMLFLRTAEQAMLTDPAYAHGRYRKNPALPMFQLLFALQFTTPADRIAKTTPAAFPQFFRENQAYDPESADANDSLWQIRAILGHDVAPGAALEQAARQGKARTYVISARQDHMVNPANSLAYAAALGTPATVLEGDCGHAAVNCEIAAARAVVETALR
jgi:homoserine O-acetyltransferase